MARSPPSRDRGALATAGALLLLISAARPAAADPMTRARELFDKGQALNEAGDCEGAVVYFRRSLRESPSISSTRNAAACLIKLERFDEALEMAEDLLTSFADQLTPADRAEVLAAVTGLRKKVGSIEVLANVEGQVSVDGRPRGKVPHDGPIFVTAGKHSVRIVKDGFEPFERAVEVAAGKSVFVDATLNVTDAPPPAVPSASRSARPYPFVTAFGGFALSDSLRSTAESGKAGAVLSRSPVSGFVGGMRGGYRFALGLALELSLGYLYAVSQLHRSAPNPSYQDMGKVDINYDLTDALRIQGPFLGMGASYRLALGDRFALVGRTSVGVLSTRSTDPVTGTAKTKIDGPVPVAVQGSGQALLSSPGFFMPELGVEAGWGGFRAGVLLGLVILATDGPSFIEREVGVRPTCSAGAPPGSVGCAPNKPLRDTDPNKTARDNDLAYGGFVLVVPQVAVGYSF